MVSKRHSPSNRLVWRITPDAPMGRWVDPLAPAPRKPSAPEVIEGGSSNWLGSSFDLLSGTEVNDDPETQPDTLWDDFFGTPPDAPNTPDK